jgi:hypothetical protein
MDDDQVTQAIEEIEHELRREDPDFVRRIRHLRRWDDLTVLCVFALLAAGAVFLTVGLAAASWPAAAAGLFALVSSVIVDHHRTRR